MMTIRSRFHKKGDMVFISHLDLVRVFERAIRRANIPVGYTQGFNPRPMMSFATALSLGVASDGEYMDIQLSEELDADSFTDRLNNVLPEGLKVIKSLVISNKGQSLMSIIASSTYLVKLKMNDILSKEYIEEYIKEFLDSDSIIEMKEKKDKKKKSYGKKKKPEFQEINIRPLIKDITLFSIDNLNVILKMHLATGSQGNIKPEVVIRKLYEFKDLPLEIEEIRIQRLDLFKEKNGECVTPLEELDIIE